MAVDLQYDCVPDCYEHDSCYQGQQDQLVRFHKWPLILCICCGWLITLIMGYVYYVNHHRRQVVLKHSAIRLKLCDENDDFSGELSEGVVKALCAMGEKYEKAKASIGEPVATF